MTHFQFSHVSKMVAMMLSSPAANAKLMREWNCPPCRQLITNSTQGFLRLCNPAACSFRNCRLDHAAAYHRVSTAK